MDFLELAITTVNAAGKLALEKQGLVKVWEKNPQDIVTEADIACEKLIKEMILKEYQNHSFIGEEGGKSGDSEYIWVIDPIDGTDNYARGYHEWCVAIALKKDGVCILSVVYQPVLNLLFSAELGKGTVCNSKRVHLAKRSLIDAVISFEDSRTDPIRKKHFETVARVYPNVARFRMTGSISATMCALANGRTDGVFRLGKMKLWDAHPGILIAREAGAIVTDINGNEWNENSESMVASNKELHQELIDLLR